MAAKNKKDTKDTNVTVEDVDSDMELSFIENAAAGGAEAKTEPARGAQTTSSPRTTPSPQNTQQLASDIGMRIERREDYNRNQMWRNMVHDPETVAAIKEIDPTYDPRNFDPKTMFDPKKGGGKAGSRRKTKKRRNRKSKRKVARRQKSKRKYVRR